MAKVILISIKPKWVIKILNGEKTLEIRKTMPKCALPIDVYIYCTKKDSLGRIKDIPHDRYFVDCVDTPQDFEKMDSGYDGKGKVVAKFTLNKWEYIYHDFSQPKLEFETDTFPWHELFEKSCVSRDSMEDYLGYGKGFAWQIDDLEIFDKPKEISEFTYWKDYGDCKQTMKLTRAPESYCYIEI